MPFTLFGDRVPSEDKTPKEQLKHPIKIFKEKRRGSWVTLIRNIPLQKKELTTLARQLKSQLGCGGGVKENTIEIQGDQVEAAREFCKKARLIKE